VTVSLRLSEAARLALRLEQRRGVRWKRLGTLFRPGKAGSNAFKVGMRVRRGGRKRAVSPGRYRIVVRGTDAAGNESRDLSREFRVVR
jgi:hypothetical protein